jgi:hypothetical protein
MKLYIVLIVLLFVGITVWFYNTPYDNCTVLRRIVTQNGTIEIVDEDCQEALPHTTTSNIIRMTENVWNSERYEETLKHERVHLDQKRRPREWEEFYRTVWNYELLASPPPDLRAADLRPNPDTAQKPWAVWRNRYVFYPSYGAERTLRDAKVRVWDLQTKQHVPLPPEWRTEFCSSNRCPIQYEHPHEMAAEYVTHGANCPSAVKLFQWFK